MTNAILIYGRKLFSLALVFNCLLTVVYAVGLLAGFYANHWTLFQPYLFNAEFLWVIIIVALLNLYPAMKIGRVKTGRLWFHHYVYGFLVLVAAGIFLIVGTTISLSALFIANNTDLAVNVGRFFVLGGLTLVIDDFGDISKGARGISNLLKNKCHQKSILIHWTHSLLGLGSLYLLIAISLWLTQNPSGITPANLIFIGSLFITTMTTFWVVIEKIWFKLYHGKPDYHNH
jgi:hypothetical protein